MSSSSLLSSSRMAALAHINTAMAQIPQKDAYVEALQRAPHLIEIESDPLAFLKYTNYDATNAAIRLAIYWAQRKLVFQDRAFLPMTLTGDGAMDRNDIDALRKGYIRILPHSTGSSSSHRGVVVWYDQSHMQLLSKEQQQRCIFYIWSVLTKNMSAAVDEGITCIGYMESAFFSDHCNENAALALTAFPIRITAVHVFCSPPSPGLSSILMSHLTSSLLQLLGPTVYRNTKIHVNLQREERKTTMLSLGFYIDDLPHVMGGSPSSSSDAEPLDRWIQERIRLDFVTYSTQLSTSSTSLSSSGAMFGGGLQQPPSLSASSSTLLPYGMAYDLELQRSQQLGQTATQVASQQLHAQTLLPTLTELGPDGNQQEPPPPSAASALASPPSTTRPSRVDDDDDEHPESSSSSSSAAAAIAHYEAVPAPSPGTEQDKRTTSTAAASAAELLDVKPPATTTSRPPPPPPPPQPLDEYARLGFASNPIVEETESIVKESMEAFEAALEQMADEDKTAYTEAMDKVPDLVQTECVPLHFLRCNNFDGVAAAKQMMNYWKLRKELFGDRALLPMTQTGLGALTPDDVVVLSSASAAILPNDAKNRCVLIGDRSRSLDSITHLLDAKLRCYFYLISIMAENIISQTEGYILLCVLVLPRFTDSFDNFAEKCLEIQRAMPARVKAIHLLVCPPKAGKKQRIEKTVQTTLSLATEAYGKDRVVMHRVNAVDDFLAKLVRFDLRKEGLPSCAGGRWKYEEFVYWQKQRVHLEQLRAKAMAATAAGFDTDGSADDNPTAAAAASDVNSDTKRERKRKLNVIHSRQKRERRRNEMKHLQEACDALREKHALLRKQNVQFERLVHDACTIVHDLERQRVGSTGATFMHQGTSLGNTISDIESTSAVNFRGDSGRRLESNNPRLATVDSTGTTHHALQGNMRDQILVQNVLLLQEQQRRQRQDALARELQLLRAQHQQHQQQSSLQNLALSQALGNNRIGLSGIQQPPGSVHDLMSGLSGGLSGGGGLLPLDSTLPAHLANPATQFHMSPQEMQQQQQFLLNSVPSNSQPNDAVALALLRQRLQQMQQQQQQRDPSGSTSQRDLRSYPP